MAASEVVYGASAGIGPLFHLLVLAPKRGTPGMLAWAFEASGNARHDRYGIELDAGMRLVLGELVPGSFALEGFASISIAPDFGGAWHPRISLEMGLSGAASPRDDREQSPPGSLRRSVLDNSPGYLGTALSSARFRWHRWQLDVFPLFIGTAIPDYGRAVRLQLGFLRAGAWF